MKRTNDEMVTAVRDALNDLRNGVIQSEYECLLVINNIVNHVEPSQEDIDWALKRIDEYEEKGEPKMKQEWYKEWESDNTYININKAKKISIWSDYNIKYRDSIGIGVFNSDDYYIVVFIDDKTYTVFKGTKSECVYKLEEMLEL